MKRKMILLIFIIPVLLCACSKEETNIVDSKMVHEHCYRNGIIENAEADLTYEIYYTGDILNKVEAKEKVTSEDIELLNNYEEAYKSIHSHYQGLSNYNTKVLRDSNSVVSTITIDYDKIDISSLIAIEGEEDNIFENNIPKVSKWKELAKKVGTKCEKVS